MVFRKSFVHTGLTVFSLSLSMTSCTDAPRQYNPGNPPMITHQGAALQTAAGSEGISPDGDLGTRNEDQIARTNSAKDITYKDGGVAGINVDTPYSQALNTLSKLQYIYKSANTDWFVYQEGLYISWTLAPPIKPSYIIITSDYLGAMNVPKRAGIRSPETLKIGTPYDAYVGKSGSTAEAFAIILFNLFEEKDDTFNCIDSKVCKVIPSLDDNTLELSFPRADFTFQLDTGILTEIDLYKHFPAGVVDTDFDWVSGAFQTANPVSLGDDWKSILKKIGTDSETTVSSRFFSKFYTPFALFLTKSSNDRTYRDPVDETLTGVRLTQSFTNNIKMGRQFIKVNQDITKENGELKLEPVDSIETPDTRVEGDRGNKAEKPTYLGTHLKIAKKFHRVFMSRLSELIKQTMLKSKPNTPIFEKILGFSNIDSKRREFISQLMQYDADKKQIKNIRFSLLENGGDLGKFDEFVFGGHIAEVVGPTLGQMVNLSSKNRSLSGFSLLQKLTLKASEISPERGEATASYQLDPKGPVYTTRFDYDPNVTIELPLKEQTKLQTVRVSTLSIPELGIILYTLQDPKSGSAPGDQIIVAIKSTSISKLTGLCGLTEDELSAQIGPTAIDKIDPSRLDRTGTDSGFKEALLAALEVKRKSKPDFKCNYIAPNDSTGLDRERKLIFPDQSVAIDFSLRDLSSFTLYATVDEVFKK